MDALERYLDTHDAILPTAVSALAPYFQPPLDPAILARYEMLQQGPLSTVPLADPAEHPHAKQSGHTTRSDSPNAPRRTFVIGERPELLLPEDARLIVSPNAYVVVDDLVSSIAPLAAQTEKAGLAYQRAHGGALPPQPTDLLPYFDPPLDAAARGRVLAAWQLAERRRGQNLFNGLKP